MYGQGVHSAYKDIYVLRFINGQTTQIMKLSSLLI